MNATDQPFTLDAVVFGQERSIRESLGSMLSESSVIDLTAEDLGSLARAGVDALIEKVAEAGAGLFQLDLADVVATGWRKHSALLDAAKRTVASPGDSELVQLATHRITSNYRAHVDLLIDDVVVSTVHFEAFVELLVKALVATIERGKITALHSGICDATASLSAEGVEITHKQAHVEIPLVIPLTGGVQLVPEAHEGINDEGF